MNNPSQTAVRTKSKSQARSVNPVRIEGLREAVGSLEEDFEKFNFGQLRQEIGKIRALRRNDRIMLLLLWMLDSVGTYIALNRQKAHPGAPPLLRSLHSALEPLILNPGMPEEEKGKVLIDQVKEYRALRNRINLEKDESEPEMSPEARLPSPGSLGTESSTPEEDATGVLFRDLAEQSSRQDGKAEGRVAPKKYQSPQEAFAMTLEEVKESIRTEFKALREELEQWKGL